MSNKKKNNVVNFPSTPSKMERHVEAILFAASEPLDLETIEKRLQSNTNVKKILENSKDIKDGLSILGVALRYVAGVEKHNKILTLHWIPKFYNFFKN